MPELGRILPDAEPALIPDSPLNDPLRLALAPLDPEVAPALPLEFPLFEENPEPTELPWVALEQAPRARKRVPKNSRPPVAAKTSGASGAPAGWSSNTCIPRRSTAPAKGP
jgi:hypothetical protein